MSALDWRSDSWRVTEPETWPQLDKRSGRVLPPQKQPPSCRLCGGATHLHDDDRRPVHKVCLEAETQT